MNQHFVELQDGRQKVFLHFQESPHRIPEKVQNTVKTLMQIRNGAELVDVTYQVGEAVGQVNAEIQYHVYLTVTTQAKG